VQLGGIAVAVTDMGDFICVRVNYSDGLFVLDKEEGGFRVTKEVRHVVVDGVRISNLFKYFLFPVN
jgi:hypothetical protein